MGRVYPIPDDAVSCRVCGATHARPARARAAFGMCDSCYNAFCYRNGNRQPTEQDFLTLLAGKLALDIQRKQRDGILGRCEAVSNWKYAGGYQCGHSAKAVRDGRRVCSLHAKAAAPEFVTESNPYNTMSAMIRELCEADNEFRVAVEGALRTTRRRAA